MNLSPHDASRTLPRRQRRRRRGVPPEEEVQRDFVAQLAETIVGQVEQQRSVYKRALDEMLERPSSSSGASSSSSSADSVLCWKRRSRRRRSAAPARQPAPRVAKRVSRAPVRSFRDIIGHEASQMELISEREWVSPDGAARVHLLQPRVHKQHAEGECGYHALHNLQRVMLALSEPDEERAASMLDLSSAVFWEDYFNMERTLLTYSETQDQSSYPWRPDLIREGVLERPYLSALLKQHTRLQASMGGRQLITSLAEIATHQLDSIASIFNKLRRAANRKRTGYQHGFMLASTNHWNAALLSQRPGRPLEIVVLESRNYDVLHLDMAKVEAEAQAHPKLQDDAWGQYLYVASRRSCKQNVHKLCLCGSGTRSIHAYYLDRQVESLLRSFHTYVSDKAPLLTLVGDADGDEGRVEDDPSAVSEPDLLTWLEHRYPPRMLVSRDLERIHEVGPEHFEPETREIFTRWVLWVGSQRVVRRSRAKDVRYFARVLRSFLEVLSE